MKRRPRFSLLLTAALVIAATALSGCDSKKKKAEAEQRRLDSLARIEEKRVQDSIDAVAKKISDSLALIQQQQAEQAAKQNALKFHVIVGSFRNPQNATNFHALQSQSHSAAKIFDSPNGFKLVSIADFATMDEGIAYINRSYSAGMGEEDEEGEFGMWVFEEGGVYDTSAYLGSLDDFEEDEERDPYGYNPDSYGY